MAEDKALTLKRLFNAIDPDRLTKDDFVNAFEAVVTAINDEKTKLSDLAERLNQAVQDARANLDETSTLTKADLTTAVASAISKIQNGKDGYSPTKGIDYFDGISPDPAEVAKLAANLIKLPEYRAPIMDGPEEIATKLDLLDEENQLAAIKKLKAEIEELKKRPVRSGGTSAMGVAQAMKYVVKRQTPTGTIDGVNATFTVSSAPYAVLSIVINGEFIPLSGNYTIAGKTITFSSAIPASYSGKDFEIVYV